VVRGVSPQPCSQSTLTHPLPASAASPVQQAHTNNDDVIVSFLHPLRCSTALLHPAKAEHTGGEDKDSSKPQPGQPISNHYLIRKPPQVRHGRLHRIALCRRDAVGDSHHSLSQPAHKPRPRALPSIIVRHGGRSGMAFGACIIPLMPCLMCAAACYLLLHSLDCSRQLNCSTSAPKKHKAER
jgi:hypothetical protein